jgi:hypothetical protein
VVSVTNTWSVGDWVYITGVAGMTQLKGNYYIIATCPTEDYAKLIAEAMNNNLPTAVIKVIEKKAK